MSYKSMFYNIFIDLYQLFKMQDNNLKDDLTGSG